LDNESILAHAIVNVAWSKDPDGIPGPEFVRRLGLPTTSWIRAPRLNLSVRVFEGPRLIADSRARATFL